MTKAELQKLEDVLINAMREAGKHKLECRDEGDQLHQERFYGMELAYFEAIRCIEAYNEMKKVIKDV